MLSDDGDSRSSVAAKLSVLYDTLITPCDGGFVVKQTDTHVIYVLRMIVNWRVARGPRSDPTSCYDREWCFYGNDLYALLRAVGAAVAWDGGDQTSPDGWDKNAKTGEYSHPSKYDRRGGGVVFVVGRGEL